MVFMWRLQKRVVSATARVSGARCARGRYGYADDWVSRTQGLSIDKEKEEGAGAPGGDGDEIMVSTRSIVFGNCWSPDLDLATDSG